MLSANERNWFIARNERFRYTGYYSNHIDYICKSVPEFTDKHMTINLSHVKDEANFEALVAVKLAKMILSLERLDSCLKEARLKVEQEIE